MTEVDLGPSALWPIVLVAVVFGAASVVIFRRFANFAALRTSSRRVIARLLEFRLYADDPVLILRSQRDLLVENGRMLRCLALPCLILAIFSVPLLLLMDRNFSNAGLEIDRPSVLTVELKDRDLSNLLLQGDRGIRVETEAVRVVSRNQVSWRILPTSNASGEITLHDGVRSFTKQVPVGPVFAATGLGSGDPRIAWVHVEYPSALVWGQRWIVWFFVFSCATALVMVAIARPGARLPKLLPQLR